MLFGYTSESKCSNFVRFCLFEMVQPLPERAKQGKKDVVCCIVFGLACKSKFSNFIRTCLFGMVQPMTETTKQGQYVVYCLVMFVSLHIVSL